LVLQSHHMSLFRFRSIRTRLSFFLILLVLAPVFGGFTLYTREAARIIESQLLASQQGILDQTVLNLNRIIGLMGTSVNYVSASPQLQRYSLELQDDNPIEQFLALQALRNTMQLVSSAAFQHQMLVFYVNNQTLVSNLQDITRNTPQIRNSQWYAKALANPLQFQWTIESFQLQTEEGIRNLEFLTLSRAFRSYDGSQIMGVTAVSILTQDILNVLDSRMVIIDNMGNRLMEDPPGTPAFVLKGPLENFWTLEFSLSEEEVFGDLRILQLRAGFFLLLLLMLLIGIILLYVYSSTQSLILLRQRAQQIEQGDLSIRMPRLAQDEIGQLANQFNGMLDRIQELIEKLKAEHLLVEEARFAQLKAQIRPHFLLNSLNTVQWAARMSGADNVSTMITALSKILERALYEKARYVSLSSELDTLKQFLILEQLRTGDQWRVTFDTDGLSVDPLCPTFCLEPLVENAIKHGLPTPDRSIMEIRVSCRQEEDRLILQVEDSGKGFDQMPDFLENNKTLRMNKPTSVVQSVSKVGGIGLENIHRRIQQAWGSTYGLRLDHRQPWGTSATITLPLIIDQPDANKEDL
jgi:two-component system sensor histidine kinase YesM